MPVLLSSRFGLLILILLLRRLLPISHLMLFISLCISLLLGSGKLVDILFDLLDRTWSETRQFCILRLFNLLFLERHQKGVDFAKASSC